MSQRPFPPLPLDHWRETRGSLQQIAHLLGAVRRALTPPRKHWWHISLQSTAAGLTTSPMRSGSTVFDLTLDLTDHELRLATSRGEDWAQSLIGQSPVGLAGALLTALSEIGVTVEIDRTRFDAAAPLVYHVQAAERFWTAFARIDTLFRDFQHGLRGETSPVQLWPHHFDLAMLWLSGRPVPGQDPADEEVADEQMNFGFVTGDSAIPEPYFYATAYPTPHGWVGSSLPRPAYWQTDVFTAAILPYSALVDAQDPDALLLDFLRTSHAAGAARMQ